MRPCWTSVQTRPTVLPGAAGRVVGPRAFFPSAAAVVHAMLGRQDRKDRRDDDTHCNTAQALKFKTVCNVGRHIYAKLAAPWTHRLRGGAELAFLTKRERRPATRWLLENLRRQRRVKNEKGHQIHGVSARAVQVFGGHPNQGQAFLADSVPDRDFSHEASSAMLPDVPMINFSCEEGACEKRQCEE